MDRTQELLSRRDAVLPRGVSRLNGLVASSASGSHILCMDGREYIDLASGIGVMSVGHSTPEVLHAINEQAAKLQHACFHVATYEPYVALCEKLVSLYPHGHGTKAMLVNSGAEAVENAVKIARQATGRSAVICYSEAFHGRTLLGLSLTSKVGYKHGCGPYAPELYRLPFPNRYRYGDGLDEAAFVERELARLRHAFSSIVPAGQVAAVIMEVVQGEGGFNPCPGAYLRGLREICSESGIVLILDEVQSGFCRTGRWSAYEHHGVVPDLSTWAKSMGGGMPIAAVIGRAEVMDGALPGTLGGTYGGNPVCCAAALAAIGLMERDDLCDRARRIGEIVRRELGALAKECPQVVGDVRGLGAMMAMELVECGDPARPATDLAADVVARCVEAGVLVIRAGTHSNILRLLPPLVIEEAVLERGLEVIRESTLAAVSAREVTSEGARS